MGERKGRSVGPGDDFRIVRGEAHKDKGHGGGSARPLQKPRTFNPRSVLNWPEDTGKVKEKQKPGLN